MPRSVEGARKFQSPLYCASWAGQYCLVAGGGGKKSSGIPNRLWCVDHSGSRLGDVVASFDTGEDAPLRMAVPPGQHCILLAVGSGGLIRVDLDLAAQPPALTKYTGEDAATLKELGHVKCMSFSSNGRLLALGFEDSSLMVFDWPSLTVRKRIRVAVTALKDALRDLDFSSAHSNKVLGATYEDGSCILWEWASATQLTTLSLPAELGRGSFNRIRFLAGQEPKFFTVVNAGGQGYLLQWAQDAQGEVVLQRQTKAHGSAITAFDVSPSGRHLGAGTSEGEIAIFPATLSGPPKRLQGAHMVFATAVAFSRDGSRLLSVSADASACTLPVAGTPGSSTGLFLVALLVLLLALLLALAARTYGWT